MGDLLVETKLLVPQRHRELVPRRRLTGIVERASTSALTVVSAPAGFGKTTLLAQLAAGPDEERGGHAVAWVSLDERDGDPRRFWSYVLHAVERSEPWRRRIGTGPPGLGDRVARGCHRRPGQRAERPPGRSHPGAGRLPPRRRPRHQRRHGLPARPPAATASSGHRHPCRPRPPVGPTARPGRAGRGARQGPALHC